MGQDPVAEGSMSVIENLPKKTRCQNKQQISYTDY